MTTSALDELKNDLYKTKGTRFNASKRLLAEQHVSNISLMTTSAYLIIISAGPAFEIEPLERLSGIWSLFFSVILLGLSAIETGANRREDARKFHDNAVRIGSLHRQAEALNQNQANEIAKLREQYDEVLADCDINHDDIDYFRHSRANTFFNPKKRAFFWASWVVQYILSAGFFYSCLIIFPPAYFFAKQLF